MTIYNITETKKFIDVLSSCSGRIDLIAENGLIAEIKPSGLPVAALPRLLLAAPIEKISLSFRDKADAQKVLHYIMGMKMKKAC